MKMSLRTILSATLLVLSTTSCVSSWGKGDLEKYGPFQVAIYSKLFKCNHDRNLNLDVSGITVYYYDFKKNENKTFLINEATQGILSIKNLDKSRKFIMFVPGYKSGINKNTEERVRQAFKALPNSYLVIFDHSPYTNNKDGFIKSYDRSVKYVHYIGKAIGQFFADLKKGGISPKLIHAIGHSLGSQILGHVGETFIENTKEKISRITGLDPAGPCFTKSLIQEQIRSGLAEYVEIYHCNAGSLGTSSVLGDVDFFANKKGQSQPHCGTPLIPGIFDSSKSASCNHKTCVLLFLASISHPDWFHASKCDNYKDFKRGGCARNDLTTAGFWNPGTAKGVYYFSTEPFDIK